MNLKQFIPKKIKLSYQLLKRAWKDKQFNYRFAQPQVFVMKLDYQISISQPIKHGHLYLNKIHNLHLASKKIASIFIFSNEIFSFWKIIGQPNAKNGYKKGRNIIDNQMQEDYGGGLCQLSGIIYHVALLGNLEIIERYNHSIDLYTDENRYSPLGCDATVVFGYRDLRIRNNSDGIIQFQFEVTNEKITVILKSEKPIEEAKLRFEITEKNNTKEVIGYNEKIKISQSIYKKTK